MGVVIARLSGEPLCKALLIGASLVSAVACIASPPSTGLRANRPAPEKSVQLPDVVVQARRLCELR